MTPTQHAFQIALKSRRQNMKKPNRVKTADKVRTIRWRYPINVERKYVEVLRGLFNPLRLYVESQFKQHGESVLRGDALHLDTVPGKMLHILFQNINKAVGIHLPANNGSTDPNYKQYQANETVLDGVADGLNDTNKDQWAKQTKQVLGFEFDTAADWWPDVRDRWAATNYKLIKSLSDQYISQVSDLAEKTVTSGGSFTDLLDDIKGIGAKMTESRVQLIARDQIGKLNGRITQARQQSIGIDSYVWMTAGDERVRGNPGGLYPNADPSHYAMEGLCGRWDDASVYSDDDGQTWKPKEADMPDMHPGEDIQCRCTASPNWKPMLKQLDAQIDGTDDEEAA